MQTKQIDGLSLRRWIIGIFVGMAGYICLGFWTIYDLEIGGTFWPVLLAFCVPIAIVTVVSTIYLMIKTKQ
jgi:hypothetical protein